MNLAKKYFQFHGKNPKTKKNYCFRQPRALIVLGDAHAIEYTCNKLHGGGDGKRAVYRHVFETPAKVCMDETGEGQLYIVGDELIVTEAGIEN